MTVRRNQPARNPREGVLQNLKKERKYYFCNILSVTVLTLTLGTEVFWQKNAKNVMKNSHIETSYMFTLIMLLSIQPVKIPEKITVFFIILVESSIFSVGQAKMPKNGVLIQ